MSYTIAGRAIKNEYIALGTLGSVFGAFYLSSRGGSKEAVQQPKSLVEKVKEAVPTGNSEEQELMDSIRKFVEEAEKEDKH